MNEKCASCRCAVGCCTSGFCYNKLKVKATTRFISSKQASCLLFMLRNMLVVGSALVLVVLSTTLANGSGRNLDVDQDFYADINPDPNPNPNPLSKPQNNSRHTAPKSFKAFQQILQLTSSPQTPPKNPPTHTAAKAKTKSISKTKTQTKRQIQEQTQLQTGSSNNIQQDDNNNNIASAANLAQQKWPILNEFNFPTNLVQGMRFVLVCQVLDGEPPIQIRWLKNNRELLPSNAKELDMEIASLDALGSSILFRSVQQSHAGNYTCIASNDFGRATFSALMAVKVPPKWRIEPKELIEASKGSQVTIDCQASGNPTPFIRWKFSPSSFAMSHPSLEQQQKLPTTTRLVASNQHVQSLENGSLSIRSLNVEDDGIYLCEADNGVGGKSLTRQTRVLVHEHAQFVDDLQLLEPQPTSSTNLPILTTNQLVTSAANVAVRATRLPVAGNSQIRLLCQPFGELPLSVEWLKDKRLVPSSQSVASFDLNSDTPIISLSSSSSSAVASHAPTSDLIKSPTTASQLASELSNRAHVNTRFSSSSSSHTNNSSAPLPYSIKTHLSRSDITDRHNPLSQPTSASNKIVGWLESELIITNAARNDAGLYQCVARNLFGLADRKLQLIIQEPPLQVELVDVAHVSSRAIGLRWHAPRDNNAPIFKYIVEYRKVAPATASSVDSAWHANAKPQTNSNVAQQQHPVHVSEKVVALPASSSYSLTSMSTIQQPSDTSSLSQQQTVTHTIHELEPLSRYTIRIIAVNVAGASRPSVALSIRTDEEVPSVVPSDVEAQVLSSKSIKLLWRTQFAPTLELIEGFFVGYKSLDSFASSILTPPSTSTPTPTPTSTSTSTTPNIAPNSSLILNAATRPENSQQHNLPALLPSASQHTFTYKTIRLTTTDSPAASSHTQVQSDATTTTTLLAPSSTITKSLATPDGSASTLIVEHSFVFEVNGLEKNTDYTFLIQCFNRKGAGPASDPLVVRTFANDPPNKITISLDEASERSVKIKWTFATNNQHHHVHQASDNNRAPIDSQIDGFVLMFAKLAKSSQQQHFLKNYKPNSDPANRQLSQHLQDQWQKVQLAPQARGHQLTNLDCGSNYALKAWAFNKVGAGEPSDVLIVSTWGKAPIAPDKRSFLSVNSTFVKLHLRAWYGAGCDIENFAVKYRLRHPTSFEWHLVSNNIQLEQQVAMVSDLTPATSYELLVSAQNSVDITNARYKFTTLQTDGSPVSRSIFASLGSALSNDNDNDNDNDNENDPANDNDLEQSDGDKRASFGRSDDTSGVVRDFFWASNSKIDTGSGDLLRKILASQLAMVAGSGLLLVALTLLFSRAFLSRRSKHGHGHEGDSNNSSRSSGSAVNSASLSPSSVNGSSNSATVPANAAVAAAAAMANALAAGGLRTTRHAQHVATSCGCESSGDAPRNVGGQYCPAPVGQTVRAQLASESASQSVASQQQYARPMSGSQSLSPTTTTTTATASQRLNELLMINNHMHAPLLDDMSGGDAYNLTTTGYTPASFNQQRDKTNASLFATITRCPTQLSNQQQYYQQQTAQQHLHSAATLGRYPHAQVQQIDDFLAAAGYS